MKLPIYLDSNSTTQVDKRIIEQIPSIVENKFGNPSSIDHFYGNDSLLEINKSREKISKLIGAEPEEIFFTSGATESNNIILSGLKKNEKNHIITSKIEHKSVLNTCSHLEEKGIEITYLNVDKNGLINLDDLRNSIKNNTSLISIIFANNEIGIINQIKEIGKIAKESGVLFHTDAVQAFGKIKIDVNEMNIDFLSCSAHKIYGLKGIGGLFIKGNLIKEINPILFGGSQERRIRPGTLNVLGIISFGMVSEILKKEMNTNNEHCLRLREKLYSQLKEEFLDIELNGDLKNRLSNNLNIFIPKVNSKALLNEVKRDLAISAGSACTSDSVDPSHVLMALYNNEERAFSSIRIGISKYNTEEEIDYAIFSLKKGIKKLRMFV